MQINQDSTRDEAPCNAGNIQTNTAKENNFSKASSEVLHTNVCELSGAGDSRLTEMGRVPYIYPTGNEPIRGNVPREHHLRREDADLTRATTSTS